MFNYILYYCCCFKKTNEKINEKINNEKINNEKINNEKLMSQRERRINPL